MLNYCGTISCVCLGFYSLKLYVHIYVSNNQWCKLYRIRFTNVYKFFKFFFSNIERKQLYNARLRSFVLSFGKNVFSIDNNVLHCKPYEIHVEYKQRFTVVKHSKNTVKHIAAYNICYEDISNSIKFKV